MSTERKSAESRTSIGTEQKNVALSLGLRHPFVKFSENQNHPSDPTSLPGVKAKLLDLPTSMVVDYVRVWEKE